MRTLIAGVLLLAAAPAFCDELIRFRQTDGTLGLVDDDDKLPPGAIVLERTPLRRAAEPQSEPDELEAEPDPESEAAADAEPAEDEIAEDEMAEDEMAEDEPAEDEREAPSASASDPEAARRNAALCTRYHLDSTCSARERSVAAGWCQRSTEARDKLDHAEENLELAQEEFDRCDDVSGSYYCSRDRLDAAQSTFAREELSVERLQDQCRKEDCMPGWTREGCEP